MAHSVLDRYPEFEVVIGIEVHVQLTTKSKMFCSSPNVIGNNPNSTICNICSGYPGTLPVANKAAIDYAILAGIANNCTINPVSSFDRKHYFYPDLPKGYQITQQFEPICLGGYVPVRLEDGSIKKIRLIRIHMEEDAGKNLHSGFSNESFVDLNRAGTPLLEIVSEPDIRSVDEAKRYLKTLRSIVQYLGICSGNMEDGAFRADTNVSVRKKGDSKFGTRCELKNINSFKYISDAVEYEIERQIEIIQEGGSVNQETRLWDNKKNISVPMRSKENAADYRYFQDPDLPFVEVNEEKIAEIKKLLPELPHQKFDRFTKKCGLSEYEADILVEDINLANYYDEARKLNDSKQIINWILRDVLGYLKEHNTNLQEFNVSPAKLAEIITMIESDKINNHAAKEVFSIVAQTGKNPAEIVKEKGLEQIGSSDALEIIIKKIIDANPEQVQQLKAGNERLMGFFVGQAMKESQGKGNPKIIQEILKKLLK